MINQESFMMIRPINNNEQTNYGTSSCDTNAIKLALKLQKLNPTVVYGYRTKTMPLEKTMDHPHFIVIVKDKVWEIMTKMDCKKYYCISNKEEWFEYHGFEVKRTVERPEWKLWLIKRAMLEERLINCQKLSHQVV